jgi:hypothetical protein
LSRRWTVGQRAAARLLATALALSGCEELGPEGGAPPPLPPKLAFSETRYEFGRVAQGTPIEHRFAFANTGDTPLTIINLHAACDCAAAVEGSREIPAHGTGAVRARLDTDAAYGAVRRTITVYSNDPNQGPIVLVLTGDVQLDVVADPAEIYLGILPPGAPAQRAALLRTGGDATHLGVPQADGPQLAVQLDAPGDGSSAVALAIAIAADAPLGPFSTVIRVPTTSARHPILRIPVAGIIAADAPMPRVLAPPAAPSAEGATPQAPTGSP